MRNLFIVLFSFSLIFSSSCAMKKSVLHLLGSQENIPTKTYPLSKNEQLTELPEICICGAKNTKFSKEKPFFISQSLEIGGSAPFVAGIFPTKNKRYFPHSQKLQTARTYMPDDESPPIYLKLGRIIHYA